MTEKKKTQKLIYIVAVNPEQGLIDEIGFVEWLKKKRAELIEMYHAETVTISSFGKMVYVIGVERDTEVIDSVGFNRYLTQAREKLIERFGTKQAFVVAV